MKRRLRSSLFTLLVSSVVSLAVAACAFEIFLRLQFPARYLMYMQHLEDRESYQRGLEQMFLALHPAGVSEAAKGWHDPELGWDHPEGVNGARLSPDFPDFSRPGLFKIALAGDSFTYGAEVEEHQTYPYMLQTMLPGSGVLNYAAPAYSIDQAILKYRRYGHALEPDLVILGIYIEDYYRTAFPFFYLNRKPLYRIDPTTGALELTGLPIPPPDVTYQELSEKHRGDGWLYLGPAIEALIQVIGVDPLARERTEREREAEFYETMHTIIGQLLSELQRDVQRIGGTLLILDIPSKDSFAPEPLEHPVTIRFRQSLLALYRELEIPYVELLEAFPSRRTREEILDLLYTSGEGGAIDGSGHFTPEGNRLAAELLAEKIEDLGIRSH